MRKLPILTLFVAAGLLAADKPLAPFVRKALTSAVYGEKAAAARYDAFAVKADQEGYPGAAALFRACAKAERIHLARFEAVLQSRGVQPSNETPTSPSVGSTRENLRTAAAAEQTERDGTYKDACDICTSARDEETAKLFDITRDVETEHANLCSNAMHNLDELKSPKSFYVCGHCGYTTDVRLPLCPLCRVAEAPEGVD
ncbi:MAG TPA: ferritin family protein [Thermoanaerobaculia bacterium]